MSAVKESANFLLVEFLLNFFKKALTKRLSIFYKVQFNFYG